MGTNPLTGTNPTNPPAGPSGENSWNTSNSGISPFSSYLPWKMAAVVNKRCFFVGM